MPAMRLPTAAGDAPDSQEISDDHHPGDADLVADADAEGQRRARVAGLRLLAELLVEGTPPSPTWYRTLEHHVFELTDCTGLDYVATLRRVVHNLRKRPDLVGSRPDRIVMMAPEEWRRGTAVAEWHDAFEAQIRRTQEVVTRVETFDAEQLGSLVRQTSGPDDGSTQLKCRRCGGHDLKITQAQTRGADEAMTNFIRCKACNKRWKM